MAVPGYESYMLPLLRYVGDGKVHHLRDTTEALAEKLGLTAEQRQEYYPSGSGPIFYHRIRWAKTYLAQAGLLNSLGKGLFEITPRGLDLLKKKPTAITERSLQQFPEFLEFKKRKKTDTVADARKPAAASETPEDIMEQGYRALRRGLEADLLAKVKSCPPSFFETLVVDLLVRMGYGGSRLDAGEALGKTGDGGVDGIIKEDKLGLDVLYVQAKRWDNTVVGRPEIQRFVGALMGKRAKKGVFITTSSFSNEATDYAGGIESKVVLIDGRELAKLMVEHNLGVSAVAAYEIKKIDSDYFLEE